MILSDLTFILINRLAGTSKKKYNYTRRQKPRPKQKLMRTTNVSQTKSNAGLLRHEARTGHGASSFRLV